MNQRIQKALKISGALIFGLSLGCVLLFFSFGVFFWQKLDHSLLVDQAQTTSVFQSDGTLLTELRGHENRQNLPLSQIPLHTRQAFIAAEDLRFYDHHGIDLYRIGGAFLSNLKQRRLAEGASTITQQLAKLTHLSADKTVQRKLKEIGLALQIERSYSKDEILEMYLNTVYFGRSAYGIQAASNVYFGIDASALSLAQSAALAAAIKAPSSFAPHINPEANASRREYILQTMLSSGMISEEDFAAARSERIWVIAQDAPVQQYSWYIDEVIREASSVLNTSADDLLRGGYRITTAYNAALQAICDTLYNDPNFFPKDAPDGEPVQSAMAVIDTQTGSILSMVGGRSYTTKRGLNRATQMRRQPGSALKPLSVYGPALERGYTTASVLLDEKTDFNGYTPQNASDRYYGLVTLRTAVRNSLNTTAVRLLEEIGLDTSIAYLNKVGIPTDDTDRNLSLALGSMSYGVTPVELSAAYAAYANGGIYYAPHCIVSIESASGETLYAAPSSGKTVHSPQNAFLMTSLLQSVIHSGTGTRMLSANVPLAGKTGTVSVTGGNRDIWMSAYNPDYSVTVWMGFDQTDAAHKLPNGTTGGKNPASVAAAFFKKAYQNKKAPSFQQPDGLVWLSLDRRAITTKGTVMLAGDSTPDEYRFSEVFLKMNRPYTVSDLWNAPPAPSSFRISHDQNGFPELHVRSSSYARYRIQRDAVGESIILTERIAAQGESFVYSDTQARPGVLYTYRIIPIHEELLQQGVWLEGEQAVQLAQVAVAPSDRPWAGLQSLFPAWNSIP